MEATKELTVPQRVLDSVYGSKAEEWRQHKNGGGWIYKTAQVEKSVYLHPNAHSPFRRVNSFRP